MKSKYVYLWRNENMDKMSNTDFCEALALNRVHTMSCHKYIIFRIVAVFFIFVNKYLKRKTLLFAFNLTHHIYPTRDWKFRFFHSP